MADPVLHQILFYDYVDDVLERRGPYRADHIELARRWKDEGRLISFGPLGTPPTGGMFVFLVDDPAVIEDYVAADPYVEAGIVTAHRVVPWTVVV